MHGHGRCGSQLIKKTAEEMRHEKGYSERVQKYFDEYHEDKKKKKKSIKT